MTSPAHALIPVLIGLLIAAAIISALHLGKLSPFGPRRVKSEEVSFASPHIRDLMTPPEVEAAMQASSKARVLLLHAPWCHHCKVMMPAYNEAAATTPSVEWARVEATNAGDLPKRSDVRGFPTIFGIKRGSGEVIQHDGARDALSLRAFANSL